jgi:hypothetical protein
MQYVALHATTLVAGEEEIRMVSAPEFDAEREEAQRACLLHSRFYRAQDSDRDYAFFDPGDDWAGEDELVGLTGWKRFTAWTAAAVASWGLVIGCVAIVRAFLS